MGSILKMFDKGRMSREASAKREQEEAAQAATDERRQVFERPMLKAELDDCLKVPYENRLLRAVVQVIRTEAVRYDVLAMQKPMEDTAHEYVARKAALHDLEEVLLGCVDAAVGGGEKGGE